MQVAWPIAPWQDVISLSALAQSRSQFSGSIYHCPHTEIQASTKGFRNWLGSKSFPMSLFPALVYKVKVNAWDRTKLCFLCSWKRRKQNTGSACTGLTLFFSWGLAYLSGSLPPEGTARLLGLWGQELQDAWERQPWKAEQIPRHSRGKQRNSERQTLATSVPSI